MSASAEAVKIPDRLFYRIGEVSSLVRVKPFVLRFWESEFKILSPEKSKSGQRLYRRVDVENLLLIKKLLHLERYSIEGARKKISELRRTGQLKKERAAEAGEVSEASGGSVANFQALREIRQDLKTLKALVHRPVKELFKA